jgi:hypothetical protein
MTGLERLAILRNISLKKGRGWIHKDIFRLLNKEDIWYFAYKNAVTKNLSYGRKDNPHILDKLQAKKLSNLRISVVDESYTPTIIKSEYFSARKKTYNDNIFNVLDKTVIQVIKIILEAIFEPLFYEPNAGLVEHKNEHSALEYFEKNFSMCNNLIQGNFELSVELINNHILCNFLTKYIDDTRFINLIRKILNAEAEISLNKESKFNKLSSLKRVIFNIYIHQFDEWVEKFKLPDLNTKCNSTLNKSSFDKAIWENKSTRRVKNCETQSNFLKKTTDLAKKNQRYLVSKNFKVNVRYVRYIEHWILGVEGNPKCIAKFKKEAEKFLINELQLTTTELKISSLLNGNISFLGYEIYLVREDILLENLKKNVVKESILRFDPPLHKILKKMEDMGIIKPLIKGFRPISKANITFLEDYDIVSYYNSAWISLITYYSGITKPIKLQYIRNLLHISCAMTLAHKHNCTCTTIFKKRGESLTTYSINTKRKISFANKSKLIFKKWQSSSLILNNFNLIAN